MLPESGLGNLRAASAGPGLQGCVHAIGGGAGDKTAGVSMRGLWGPAASPPPRLMRETGGRGAARLVRRRRRAGFASAAPTLAATLAALASGRGVEWSLAGSAAPAAGAMASAGCWRPRRPGRCAHWRVCGRACARAARVARRRLKVAFARRPSLRGYSGQRACSRARVCAGCAAAHEGCDIVLMRFGTLMQKVMVGAAARLRGRRKARADSKGSAAQTRHSITSLPLDA